MEPEHFLGLRASVDLRMRPFDPHLAWPRFYSGQFTNLKRRVEGFGRPLLGESSPVLIPQR